MVSTKIVKYRNINLFFPPIPSTWFWTFHLSTEGIISHESRLRVIHEWAAIELKILQLTGHNTNILWTIADKVCIYHADVLVQVLHILCSFFQLTCYCNEVCYCKTVNHPFFWQVDNTKTPLVICQSSVNTSDVRIEIKNNAGLSSFSQGGKPNDNSRLENSSIFSSVRIFRIYWKNNILAALVTWGIKINICTFCYKVKTQ